MRKKIIAANWKMNLNYAGAMALTDELTDSFDNTGSCSIILAPPFVYLHDLVSRIQSQPDFSIASQNCFYEDKGAYTGEISAEMLSSIGVEYVIIGHSERRTIFKEDDEMLAKKVSKAISHGLIPIFCCGENLSQRENGRHLLTVEEQLKTGLFHVSQSDFSECIIAYEPLWAIGTGVNATSAQAQEMHAFIRKNIKEKYGDDVAGSTSILYGGSVTSKNAEEIFSCQDVDGGLIGGASLKANEFLAIIKSMNGLLISKS